MLVVQTTIKLIHLTQWGWLMHIYLNELGHQRMGKWLVTWLVPSHYLNQCWHIVNRMLKNIFQWTFPVPVNLQWWIMCQNWAGIHIIPAELDWFWPSPGTFWHVYWLSGLARPQLGRLGVGGSKPFSSALLLSQFFRMVIKNFYPDNKVHGATMGPIWGRQDPGGPHVGPTNLAIWVVNYWISHSYLTGLNTA